MRKRSVHQKQVFAVGVAVLLALNLYTFVTAYPETYTASSGISSGSILAKDFSAYYIGAWRLWNNPSQIYTHGFLADGEPFIPPQPEQYKYLPSFLLLISPLIYFEYQTALLAFDLIQITLLPALAYMLYRLLEKKGLILAFAVLIVALLQPFPAPNGGLSLSYYWQWAEGQAKVLETFLLVLAFYLGHKQKPVLSGVAFAFGCFDLRFGLLAAPLFVMYNRNQLKRSVGAAAVVLFVSNAFLVYPGVGSGFLAMVWTSGLGTPLYYYSFIPFLTLLCLIVVNARELLETFDFKKAWTTKWAKSDMNMPSKVE